MMLFGNSSHAAEIKATVSITNELMTDENFEVELNIFTPDNQIVSKSKKILTIKQDNQISIDLKSNVDNPSLWSPETPYLYSAVVTLNQDNQKIDQYQTDFGIRTIEFSADKGFLLNGNNVLLKGACVHHDNGLLGAAAFTRAEERRVERLKANGYNAIRTSHNPPSKKFLDACDRLGMLVIDETFDMWIKPKRPNDYSNHYKENWKKDTKAMLLRDRNHPSIIMWSIGNEVQERADSSGLAIAQAAYDFVKSIDSTRPVTAAICAFWDNPGKEWDDSAPAFEILDVGGYNYQPKKYETDHEKYPERIMYGSESVAQFVAEYWGNVEKFPYVIGDFLWTGIDYLGEATIGKSMYKEEKDVELPFHMKWPWYHANCGDIDLLGNKKMQSYYRDVVWGLSKLEIAVHEPIPDGMHEIVFFWGWPKEFKSWNWQGHEGEPLQVNVYSTYPKVRLELNGETIGEKEPNEEYIAQFEVPYSAGELKAIGLQGDEVKESQVLKTTGPAFAVKIDAERDTFPAGRGEIVYINVEVTDQDGNLIPQAELPVELEISGEAELIAAGNASPFASGSFQDQRLDTYLGKGLIIVRSTGKPGEIVVKAVSDGIKADSVKILAE